MAIRLIASDLDGTLFGPESIPEPRTVDAVNAVVKTGVIFAAVTGRSHFGGAERVTSTGATVHWFIGSNGGHRLNMATDELEERLIFDQHDVARLQDQLPREFDGLGFGFEHAEGFTYDDNFRSTFPTAFDGGQRRDTTRWAPHDIGKIFAAHPSIPSSDLVAAAAPHAPAGSHLTTSGGAFIEFTPAGADKALGLARLCDQLGVGADEVVAFGDNHNDVSMLAWAGRGVAMANATDEAKAAADEVTATNADFGVAQILEQLVL